MFNRSEIAKSTLQKATKFISLKDVVTGLALVSTVGYMELVDREIGEERVVLTMKTDSGKKFRIIAEEVKE